MGTGLNDTASYQGRTHTTQCTTAHHLLDASTASRYTMARPTYRITPDVIAAVIEQLRDKSKHDVETGCIEFTGALTPKGYGKIRIKGLWYLTHRIMAVAGGKMSQDSPLQVDHLCSNKRCMNPDHLEAVTSSVNNKRAFERGERARTAPNNANVAKTHCPQGHEYSPENTYVYPSRSARRCKTCDRFRVAESRRKARNNNNNNNQKVGPS